jgi:hypothetical protein
MSNWRPTLYIIHYPLTEPPWLYGINWTHNLRPAVETAYPTEQAARDAAAKRFPQELVDDKVRTWSGS